MKHLILLILSASVLQLEAVTEVKKLSQEASIFDEPLMSLKNKYRSLTWDQQHNTANKDLSLFGKPIVKVILEEDKGNTSIVHFVLHNNNGENASEAKAAYNAWGKLLQESIGKDVKGMPKLNLDDVTYYRAAWNRPNGIYVLSRSESSGKSRDIRLSVYRKDLGVSYLKMSGYQRSGQSGSGNSGSTGRNKSGDIDEQKRDISKGISEIKSRKAPRDVTGQEQKAVNLLNIYRYLSHVNYNVQSSPDLNNKALQAANACKKAGKLSHSIGSFTDKSNLAMNTGNFSMAISVTQYVQDNGANNRERRGHRRWCLNHKMGKAGFGITGSWSAMYCFDGSGKSSSKNYGYPGIGAYPIEYLHGNAWSYYLVDGMAPEKCSVEVYKMDKYITKTPNWSDKISGNKLPVPYVNTFQFSIIFEPQNDPVTQTGTYLVRIKGGKLKEQYLVHLYK